MTKDFTFTIEIKTTDDVPDDKVEMTVAEFIGRLSDNPAVLTTDVEMETGGTPQVSEQERESLLRAVERVSRDDVEKAMQIASSLTTDETY